MKLALNGATTIKADLETDVRVAAEAGYQRVYSIELFRPEYWEWDPPRLAREAKRSMEMVLGQSGAISHRGGGA